MAEVKMIKLGGRDVVCTIENRMSNYNVQIGVPLVMSTVREAWNKKGISLPTAAMSSEIQLAVGSDVHREIMLYVEVPVNLVYNSASMFHIVEQLVDWSMRELKATRFISVNMAFQDKDGNQI